MEIINFNDYNQVGATGECPHCRHRSYFKPLTSHRDNSIWLPSHNQHRQKIVSACECEACKNYVLVVGVRQHAQQNQGVFTLIAVYPPDAPDETIEDNIPPEIGNDFKEALRCNWIKAYRATVVMCRRAIQSSAIALKANGNKLIDQIDDLFRSGKITESLKDFAHEIRLSGNDGAHPDKDGLNDVTNKDAADTIEFTRAFLNYVYVMPAMLRARKSPPLQQTSKAIPLMKDPGTGAVKG